MLKFVFKIQFKIVKNKRKQEKKKKEKHLHWAANSESSPPSISLSAAHLHPRADSWGPRASTSSTERATAWHRVGPSVSCSIPRSAHLLIPRAHGGTISTTEPRFLASTDPASNARDLKYQLGALSQPIANSPEPRPYAGGESVTRQPDNPCRRELSSPSTPKA